VAARRRTRRRLFQIPQSPILAFLATTPKGLSMRSLPHLSRSLAALAAGLGLAGAAQAAAPMVKTSGPGYHRMMLGEFEITALSDGTVPLPVDQLLKAPAPLVRHALADAYLGTPLETSVIAYLVNTGGKLVLVDTGAGSLFGPTLGHLVERLKAAGYQPEQVDEIYLTHLHSDHLGGLTAGTAAAFPNAVVRADQHDTDYWLSHDEAAKAPADLKPMFANASAALAPYVAAGHLKPFSGATELVPGVRAQPSYGHTPGHTTYVVESGGQKLLLIGDLIHVGAVQFGHPEVTITFDSNPQDAAAARRHTFAAVAKQGDYIGAAHLPFPGIGHLRQAGKGFRWIPVNYAELH
jgi:glyoxylase-like metal-dependent hydrolase (beta-lactamase superfamily II)